MWLARRETRRDLRTRPHPTSPLRQLDAVSGYHPLLAVAAGTGDMLMARLREGRAAIVRVAAHFLRETVGRRALPGPRASSRCGPTVASMPRPSSRRAGRWTSASPSPRGSTAETAGAGRGDPRAGRTPIPYWTRGGCDEISWTAFADEKNAQPVRLIVRRVCSKSSVTDQRSHPHAAQLVGQLEAGILIEEA